MSREDPREGSADVASKSQMLQCGECGQFFPARAVATTDEVVPAGAGAGGRCPNCGGDAFEQVVLDPEHSGEPERTGD
jgi:methionyl-tRNA synthetase